MIVIVITDEAKMWWDVTPSSTEEVVFFLKVSIIFLYLDMHCIVCCLDLYYDTSVQTLWDFANNQGCLYVIWSGNMNVDIVYYV